MVEFIITTKINYFLNPLKMLRKYQVSHILTPFLNASGFTETSNIG